MARWKLTRIKFGEDQLLLSDGEEKTIGRAVDNSVAFSSLVISRNHCILKAEKGKLTITDLKSSNGVYVGLNRIPTFQPYEVKEREIIGLGWTEGVAAQNIDNKEKYMFKVLKIPILPDRIKFEVDSELEGIKKEIEDLYEQPPTSNHVAGASASVPTENNTWKNNSKSIPKNADHSNPITNHSKPSSSKVCSPIIETKHHFKRKHDEPSTSNDEGQPALKNKRQLGLRRSRNLISYEEEDDVISISDSDTEMPVKINIKKPALETVPEIHIKTEKEDIDLEYFNVKQEYLGYDDEAIQIDSDSDSESEQWFLRLSQSSPGRPFLKVKRESKIPEESSQGQKIPDECSYSQIEDFGDINGETDEDYECDMISIPAEPPSEKDEHTLQNENTSKAQEIKNKIPDHKNTVCKEIDQPSIKTVLSETDQEMEHDYFDDLIMLAAQQKKDQEMEHDYFDDLIMLAAQQKNNQETDHDDLIMLAAQQKKLTDNVASRIISEKRVTKNVTLSKDVVDGLGRLESPKHGDIIQPSCSLNDVPVHDKAKRAQMIEPLKSEKETELKSKKSEIGSKAATANVKVTNSNRGAFLTDIDHVVKPMSKCSPLKSSKGKEKSDDTTSKREKDTTSELMKSGETSSKDRPKHGKTSTSSNNKTMPSQDTNSKKKNTSESKSDKSIKSSESKSDKPNKSKHKSDKKGKNRHSIDTDPHKANLENQIKPIDGETNKRISIDSEAHKALPEIRIPLKSLKPLSSSDVEALSGKPISKVDPFPSKKVKKTVRFSEAPPKVHTFIIEEGNRMKRTSLAKSSLVDIRQRPTFSLEKLALVKILRWNPHWLVEQMNFTEPPPILGTSVPPVSVYHSFDNHDQYHSIFGDLILMEIWESLTQGHLKARGSSGLQLRIAHVPPVPAPDRNFELFSLSVNVSVPNTDSKSLPRQGEILNVSFGPENAKIMRFFYVHNVRFLPSPPNNVNTFCVVSLHACYTDKMKTLKQGELMVAVNLGFIQKELLFFEAMDNLSGSPLLDAILRPDPKHFQKNNVVADTLESNFTEKLNESQLRAVTESVAAALSDQPCISMVQGPPGTGKSCVISAIVMSYFNDANRKRYHNRGKILICATSNAAVDGLVLRLLRLRHELEREDRFKLVRVGRTEAMHKKAQDMSSQNLAQRNAAARQNAEPARPGLNEEISHLEAKINMWKTQALDSKDQVRIAYCQQKIQQTIDRIVLLRNAGGGGGTEKLRGEQLQAAERLIIDGADIIVTTLASAHHNKMRGLKRRIALCIIDEAGQAIEPETLIPLTLDVTNITLIGDPQQLPGYLCSQRAKKHGLGESLFSRITSCIELWPAETRNPVVLLNRQYRMHPDIVDYPNRAFYNNLIQTPNVQPRPNINVLPYLLLSISSGDKGQGSCGGNEMESWGVARLVASLCTVLNNTLSLAVITPYNAHKELIKRNLRVLQNANDIPVEVNTVDSFQGQERDVVVVSLARSQGVGFLTDAGRMNVMLTRAKHALIVCLNPHAMIKNLQWRTLVEDAQIRNLYRTLPNRLCVGPSGAVNRDEVLQYVAFQRPPQR